MKNTFIKKTFPSTHIKLLDMKHVSFVSVCLISVHVATIGLYLLTNHEQRKERKSKGRPGFPPE